MLNWFDLLQFGTTALIWAARRGDLEVAKCFIENGATVDASGMVRIVTFSIVFFLNFFFNLREFTQKFNENSLLKVRYIYSKLFLNFLKNFYNIFQKFY